MSETNGRGILSQPINFSDKRKSTVIDFPDLGYRIQLREISAAQIKEVESDVVKQLALMIVDEHGERIYKTDDQIQALSEMPGAIATRLIEEGSKLNGVTREAQEDALKNSAAGPSGASAGA